MEVTFTEVFLTKLPLLVCFNPPIEIYIVAIPMTIMLVGAILMILSIAKTHNGIVIDNHYSYDENVDVARYYCKVKYGEKICENVAVKGDLVYNKNGDDAYWKNRIDDVTRNDFMQSFVDSICKINSTLHVFEPLFVGECGYELSTTHNVGVAFLIVGGAFMFAFLMWIVFVMYIDYNASRRRANEQIRQMQITQRINEQHEQRRIEQQQQIRERWDLLESRLLRRIESWEIDYFNHYIEHEQTQIPSTEQIDTFDETKQITCSICLVDFDSVAEQITLKCKHKFHLSCIFNCFTIKNECPICKRRHVYDNSDGDGAENV
jgi:hypothetical protein